jgi:hypothetical protein
VWFVSKARVFVDEGDKSGGVGREQETGEGGEGGGAQAIDSGGELAGKCMAKVLELDWEAFPV